MTSAIDATFPTDNVKVSKATLRAQLLIIKNEISALQVRTGLPGAKAFYGFLDAAEIQDVVERFHKSLQPSNVPRDIAFGRVSLT